MPLAQHKRDREQERKEREENRREGKKRELREEIEGLREKNGRGRAGME